MKISKQRVRQIISEELSLLYEYVVPMGFSLERWKAHRKKHKISNVEYHREHPKKKWKVVHGHKKGQVGKSLPGLHSVSYRKATSAHSAIAMRSE